MTVQLSLGARYTYLQLVYSAIKPLGPRFRAVQIYRVSDLNAHRLYIYSRIIVQDNQKGIFASIGCHFYN
jgi:hypothetical protein